MLLGWQLSNALDIINARTIVDASTGKPQKRTSGNGPVHVCIVISRLHEPFGLYLIPIGSAD